MGFTDIAAADGSVLFHASELACKATGEGRLDPRFVTALTKLRLDFARPMLVNSCCRSKAYNAQIGGHPRSLHVYDDPAHPTEGSMAIDIRTLDGDYRLDLLGLAANTGWSIGLGRGFLHLDRRIDIGLPRTTFTYPPGSNA